MEIFQLWLDRAGQSLFDDAFDTYADLMSLPFVLITTRRTLVVTEREELREGFDAFRGMMRSLQATDLFRISSGVYPVGGTILCGSYDTHLLRGGNRLIEAFRSSAILRMGDDGVWRATCVANAMSNRSWPIRNPRIEASDAPLMRADTTSPDWLRLARQKLPSPPEGPDHPFQIGGLAPEG